MKKDISVVVITFGLIGLMLTGGSFMYANMILAEEGAWDVESTDEGDEVEEQLSIGEENDEDSTTEETEAKEVLIETNSTQPVLPKPVTNTTVVNDSAKKQAEYEATQQAILEAQQTELKKKQAEADLLAQQLAEQKAKEAQAQKIADEKKAAEKAAAKKKSRRSHAS